MDGVLLNLAGIPLTVYSSDQRLFSWWLEEGGAQAISEQADQGIVVDLLGPYQDEYDCTVSPQAAWQDGRLVLEHPNYRASYHVLAGQGTAQVSGELALIAMIRTLFTVILVQHDGFVLHSSAIFRDNQAYIFSGQSGAGKSTVIKLTPQPILYSDEMSFLRRGTDGLFYLHDSPFRSEFYSQPQAPTAKLAGLFFLHQDQRDYVEKLAATHALTTTLSKLFFPVLTPNPYGVKLFQLIGDFLQQVSAYQLHFRKSPDFWRCIQHELSGQQES